MKPQTVLKIDPVGKTVEQIYAVRNRWIREYQKYIETHFGKEELGTILIDRVYRAAEMLIKRYANVSIDEQNQKDVDSDFDYDDHCLEYQEENASLDGDFPLGNAYDADFATPYFTIENLVRIQFGETYSVPTGYYVEPAYDVLIRKGFIHELLKEWAEAEMCYRGAGMSKSVQRREFECRRKKEVEGENAYGYAQHYMENGEWSKVYDYLQKAVDNDHSDAMVDMGLGRIYGTFSIPKDDHEGLQLLRKAAMLGNLRACNEMVELYDNGSADIEGEEAKQLCEKAAKAGDKQAIARLEMNFDTRPLREIYHEQQEKGNVDALWWLYQNERKNQKLEEAQIWYDKALAAGQLDALLAEAQKHVATNIEMAKQYLLQAADQNCELAMIELSKLERSADDLPFWEVANKQETDNKNLLERHQNEFNWLLKAAECGSLYAMTKIVIAYHYGYPCERNDELAFLWASRAVEKEDAYAMYQLGYFYENAYGCDKEMQTAVLYYTNAAEEGIFEAMIRLAEIYGNGKDGIKQDKKKANRYLFMSGIGRD